MVTYNRGGMVEDKHSGVMWAVVVAVVTKVLVVLAFFSQQRRANFPLIFRAAPCKTEDGVTVKQVQSPSPTTTIHMTRTTT